MFLAFSSLPGQLHLVSQPLPSGFFLDFQDKYLEMLCSSGMLAFDVEGPGFLLEEASCLHGGPQPGSRAPLPAQSFQAGNGPCRFYVPPLPSVHLAVEMRLKMISF